MKITAYYIAPALALLPAFAAAQTPAAAPAPSPAPLAAEMSAGMAFMSKVMAAQMQARTAMLAALTPAHRDLLAQVVGQLAVASDPNVDAAASRLDAALSPDEVSAIGNIESAKRAKLVSDSQTVQTTLTPQQKVQVQHDAVQAVQAAGGSRLGPAMAKAARDESDPGHVLLSATLFAMLPGGKLMQSTFAPSGSQK